MTETAAPAPPAALEPSLQALRTAITAADALGLDPSRARSVLGEVDERLRLPTDAVVVALAGGTGVGKSSLLNALADANVSTVGVRRPTTGRPVGWLSRPDPGLESLLGRLGVSDFASSAAAERRAEARGRATMGDPGAEGRGGVAAPGGEAVARPERSSAREGPPRSASVGQGDMQAAQAQVHAGQAAHAPVQDAGLGAPKLAVVDLPDLDSLDEGHRRLVEGLLPRLDAVIWTADPEKYADGVFHWDFLHAWAPRLASQLFVVNKRDTIAAPETARVVSDAARLLRSRGLDMPVVATAAVDGRDGIGEVRRWLDRVASDKTAAIARLAAAAEDAVRDVAAQAGVGPDGTVPSLVATETRNAAVAEVAERMIRLADVDGMQRLAVAATERQALDTTGPLAPFRAGARAVGLGGGEVPTPRRYLERWRERGSLLRVADPAIPALRDAVSGAPAGLRPALAAAALPVAIARRLEPQMDVLPSGLGPSGATVPSSRGWGTIGWLQAVAVGVAVLAAAWFAAGFFIRLPLTIDNTGVVAVAIVGAVIGLALRLILQRYARYVGRKWGRGLAATVERSIRDGVEAALFGPVDQVEHGRRALGAAVRQASAARPH